MGLNINFPSLISKTITQALHGFSVNDVLTITGGSYTKAKADSEVNSAVCGMVYKVIGVNNFVMAESGYVTGLSALSADTIYYLSQGTAGLLTAVKPATGIIKTILVTDTTTSGYFMMGGNVTTEVSVTYNMPTGVITPYGGSSAPSTWLMCDGTSYLRADYVALFAVIGTTYGFADGTHFNVPDLRTNVPVGYKNGDATFGTLGATGGAKTTSLATTDIPAHTHGVSITSAADAAHTHAVSITSGNESATHTHNYGAISGTGAGSIIQTGATFQQTTMATGNESATHTHAVSGTSAAGSSHTHAVSGTSTASTAASTAPSVLQPYVVANYIIKT
jgi:microcystin-dependent protein